MRQTTKSAGWWVMSLGLTLFACIERDNPFDPIHAVQDQAEAIRASQKPFFDSLHTKAQELMTDFKAIRQVFAGDTSAWSLMGRRADSLRANNDRLRLRNDSIALANLAAARAEDLVNQIRLDTLPLAHPAQTYEGLNRVSDGIRLLKSLALGRIDSIRSAYTFLIYTDAMRSAEAQFFDTSETQVAQVVNEAASWLKKVALANGDFQEENIRVAVENLRIDQYNTDLDFKRLRGTKPIITSPESLKIEIAQVVAGDTLFLDSGTFDGRFVFRNLGDTSKPILIQGHPRLGSIITSTSQGELVLLDNVKGIDFRNLVFKGSSTTGVRIVNQSEGVTFKNCDFSNNGQGGLDVADGGVTVRDCRFFGNKGDGIRYQPLAQGKLSMNLFNILVVHNGGNGIVGVDPIGIIQDATIADNGADGINFAGKLGEFQVFSTIIAYQQRGYGVSFTRSSSPTTGFTFSNCGVFGNARDNFSQPLPALPSIWVREQEPRFVSRDTVLGFDYTQRPDSDLLGIGWVKR